MKVLSLTIIVLSNCSVFAQLKSYSFVVPLPPESADIMAIPPKLFGTYTDTATNQSVVIRQRGIFIQNTVYGQLPVAMVNDSSVVNDSLKYTFRNESIFGVVENDSLPCFLNNGYYYFGMIKKTELFSFNGANKMRKADADQDDYVYLISMQEGLYWLPMILEFKSDSLILRRPVFDDIKDPFKNIIVQFHEEDKQMYHIYLNPSLEEWNTLPLNNYFKDEQVFLLK